MFYDSSIAFICTCNWPSHGVDVQRALRMREDDISRGLNSNLTLVTTAPAPTTAPSPIVRPPFFGEITIAEPPNQQSLPMVIGYANSGPAQGATDVCTWLLDAVGHRPVLALLVLTAMPELCGCTGDAMNNMSVVPQQ